MAIILDNKNFSHISAGHAYIRVLAAALCAFDMCLLNYLLTYLLSVINHRRELEIEYGIPYLHIWAQAYVNLRKIYINLENRREHPHKPYIARK